ncbi:NYN domain-containing protein [Planomonospora alba]|uniref:NYN domain-containing protein n=1 Tax=Planomonospora alba TaxID=161354 RepID=A0ABP6MLK8_9ACTN
MDQVALFIDFENLAVGAKENLPPQADPVPFHALELLCRKYGNTSVRRAYADWTSLRSSGRQQDLALNGIDLIQVTRFGANQKNAADMRIAVDAMEVLFTRAEIASFVLVTGDSDYAPLVMRLREYGKYVVGVGTQASASQRLVAVCSEYKYWGTLVAEVDPEVRKIVGKRFHIADAEQWVRAALEERPDGSAPGAWLKQRMRTLSPSFDERNYGCQTFREFLERLPHLVRIELVQASDMQVVLLR